MDLRMQIPEKFVERLSVAAFAEAYGLSVPDLVQVLEQHLVRAPVSKGEPTKQLSSSDKNGRPPRRIMVLPPTAPKKKEGRSIFPVEDAIKVIEKTFEDVDWGEEVPIKEIADAVGSDYLALRRNLTTINSKLRGLHGWGVEYVPGDRGRGGKAPQLVAVQY